jgi:hypothetical protein
MQEIMNRQWWGGTLPDPLRPELGEGWLFDWRFEIPDALPWLDFDQTPGAVGGGGTFDGMPTLVSHVTAEPIPFRVRIYQYRLCFGIHSGSQSEYGGQRHRQVLQQ